MSPPSSPAGRLNDLVRQEPSAVEASALARLDYVLEPLSTQDRVITIGYLRMILRIAKTPGITVTQLANDLGIFQASASRALLELGQKSRTRSPSLGLIGSEPDAEDIRYKHYYLTRKGAALVDTLLERMGVSQCDRSN
jgi:DNA-binding MarR family transcriptional regulator